MRCVFPKGFSRAGKLVACLYNENQVVIHDLETGAQKVIKISHPWKSSASQHLLAIVTHEDGLHLFSTDGVFVHIIPDSTGARCVAFHPRNTNVLATGYGDGTVRMWDVTMRIDVSSFQEHTHGITNIRFTPDCRLFLSSHDHAASIVTLDDQFQIVSSVKLEGHTDIVTDALFLRASNQCVTCSNDDTIKVWDCQTGTCLRTLVELAQAVKSLAIHPNGQYFASGSEDRTIIIWSSKTFEVLRRISFPSWVRALMFGESDILYAAVIETGVMSCNVLTSEMFSPVVIAKSSDIPGLALGMTS
jgi:WD40 repeat protein